MTDALVRLRSHGSGTSEADGYGFADVLWRYRQSQTTLHLEDVWDDIATCLGALEMGEETVPLPVAYAVAEVLSAALAATLATADESVTEELRVFAWRVACGWEAVLAGDVENVAEHVRLEEAARGLRNG